MAKSSSNKKRVTRKLRMTFPKVKSAFKFLVSPPVLFKNILVASFKSFKKKVKLFFSKLKQKTQTEGFRNFKDNVKFIGTYGILGYLAVYSGFHFGHWTPINILGYGSIIYLFIDLFKYIVETLRGRK